MRFRSGRLPIVFGIASIFVAPLFAAETAPSDAKSKVDALFAEYDRSDAPGCALGIYQDGRIVYSRGYGMANLELRVANSPQTVFDIGSIGKQFTSFSILLLARDGKLSLDDDIRKFLPELPDFGKRVTIRHLLHHVGGLRDYIGILELEGHPEEDLTTEPETLEALARQKGPIFAPGDRYEYSNTGYFLLGQIVRRASGKSLRDFAQERIFGPLAMTHTQYNEDHTRVIPNRATGYRPRAGGGFSIEMSDFEQNGDGGVLTTVEDLFLWDRNFAEPRVGDRALIDEMEKTGVLNDGKAIDYAKGLRVTTYRGLRAVGHTGAWAGYLALLYRFPDEKFSVSCLCNRTSVNRVKFMHQIADIYLADKLTGPAETAPEKKPRVAVSATELARFAGAYRDPKSGDFWRASVEGGGLLVDAGTEKVPLESIGSDRFVPKEEGNLEVRFEKRPAGGRPALVAAWEDEDTQRFEPVEPWTPPAGSLSKFAGLYTSDEVPTLLRFTAGDGGLVLKHRTIPPNPWTPTVKDSFTLRGWNIAFTRDSGGKVDGFRLSTSDLSGIRFRRIGS